MKDPNKSKVPPDLYRQLAAEPNAVHHLILRVRHLDAPLEQQLADAGLQVRARTTLVPMLAVRCTGSAVLALLDEPWLIAIEPDRPVQTH